MEFSKYIQILLSITFDFYAKKAGVICYFFEYILRFIAIFSNNYEIIRG
jgi:hypothetical protein